MLRGERKRSDGRAGGSGRFADLEAEDQFFVGLHRRASLGSADRAHFSGSRFAVASEILNRSFLVTRMY